MSAAPSLSDLQRIKRWLVRHRARQPVEYQAFDAVLTVWMMGWIGWAPALLLEQALWFWPLCLLAMHAPALYVRGRRRLQAGGRLRCDWLVLLPSTTVRT